MVVTMPVLLLAACAQSMIDPSLSFKSLFSDAEESNPTVWYFVLTPVNKAVAVPAESGTCLLVLYVCWKLFLVSPFDRHIKKNLL